MTFNTFLSRILKSLSIGVMLAYSDLAFGAACCGGNFASPNLISGDEKGLLSISVSQGQITDFADRAGDWRRQMGFSDRSLQLSGATLLSDRWQMGALTSLKQQIRSEQDAQATRMGDTSILLGYEALPEWVYDPFVPRTYVFAQVTAPTGVSRYESEQNGGVDVTGGGFWNLGAGFLLTKIWGAWDTQFQGELHRGLARDFNSASLGKIHVTPGWGRSLFLAGGYSVAKWRFGTGLRESREEAMDTRGTITSVSATKQWTSVVFTVNYLLQAEWAAALTYNDDTLIGNPTNAFIGRSVIATIQRRWAR